MSSVTAAESRYCLNVARVVTRARCDLPFPRSEGGAAARIRGVDFRFRVQREVGDAAWNKGFAGEGIAPRS
jgi:hypothetical protein